MEGGNIDFSHTYVYLNLKTIQFLQVPAYDNHINVKMQLLKEQLDRAKDERNAAHQQPEPLSEKSEGVKRDLRQFLETGLKQETQSFPMEDRGDPFSDEKGAYKSLIILIRLQQQILSELKRYSWDTT